MSRTRGRSAKPPLRKQPGKSTAADVKFVFNVEALASIVARAFDAGWLDRDALQRVKEADAIREAAIASGEPVPLEAIPSATPQHPCDISFMAERVEVLVNETIRKLRAKQAQKKVVLPPAALKVVH